MSDVLIKVINLSLSASWLILAVILLRAIFKKAPKWFPCALWAIVAIRLIVPFSFESATSVLPSSEPIPSEIVTMEKPQVNSGITYINNMINPVIEKVVAAPVEKISVVNSGTKSADTATTVDRDNVTGAVVTASAERLANESAKTAVSGQTAVDTSKSGITMQNIVKTAMIVWISGAVMILGYATISAWRLKRRISASVEVEEGVLACDEVQSPFIFGILRPKIYVPSSICPKTLEYVLAHERAHLARRDNWWKPLGFLLLAVYWFNPLSWAAYILLCRDIEMACDEKVIRDMEKNRACDYSQALLDCSIRRTTIAACPLAFGEVGVKQRVKNVLGYKKPKYAVVALLIAACAVISGCFLTSPKKKESGSIKHAVALPNESKLDFSDFSVEVKNAISDGSTVAFEYAITCEKVSDFPTIENNLEIYSLGAGKINGVEADMCLTFDSQMTSADGKTRKYSATEKKAISFCPCDSFDLIFTDSRDMTKKTITMETPADAKIYALTAKSKDQIDSETAEKLEWITDCDYFSEIENFYIDQIILTESKCAVLWGYKQQPQQGYDFEYGYGDLQIAVGSDDYVSFSNLFKTEGVVDQFVSFKNRDDLLVRSVFFNYPEGETQSSMLKKLRNAHIRMPAFAKVNSEPVATPTPLPHSVALPEESERKFNCDDFTIELKNASFDGSKYVVEYETRWTGLDTYDTSASSVFLEGSAELKYNGLNGYDSAYGSCELIEDNGTTRLYRVTGYAAVPSNTLSLGICVHRPDTSPEEYSLYGGFVLQRAEDAKIYVLTPEKIDEKDFGAGNVDYLTGLKVESDTDEYQIERVVLSESYCAVYWKKIKNGDTMISDLQITDASGSTHSLIEEFDKDYGVIKSNVSGFDMRNDDGSLCEDSCDVIRLSFMYPEGETQETILKRLQSSELKLVSGETETWKWFD